MRYDGRRWVRLVAPAQPTSRVLMFPHAGGGPSALLSVARMCPPDTEFWGLTLPGRESRAEDLSGDTVADLVASVGEEFAHRPALPTVNFGCSLGGLVAVRAAAAHPQLCEAVVVASQSPGERDRLSESRVDVENVNEFLLAAGMTTPEILEVTELREMLAERLGSDLPLVNEGARNFSQVVCDQDIFVLAGIDDPVVPVDVMSGWRSHTRGTAIGIALFGGHFAFLEPGNGEIARLVFTRACATAVDRHSRRHDDVQSVMNTRRTA